MVKDNRKNSRRKSVTKVATTTAAVILGGFGFATMSSSPAQADAANCSLAGDGFIGSVCIDVRGSGTRVDSVKATFRPDPGRFPDQTCDRTYEVMYHPVDALEAVTRSQYLEGCKIGYLWDWVTWEDLPELEDGSMLCVRTQNNQIETLDDHWTTWECVEMKTNGGIGSWFEGGPGTGWF